jgi:hypothetical protein
VGEGDFVVRHANASCELDELVHVSFGGGGKMTSVDKPPRCDRPHDGDLDNSCALDIASFRHCVSGIRVVY